MAPDLFVGIEFRGIRGKPFDVQARMTREHLAHGFPLMNRPAVPQQHDRAAELTQHQTQKVGDFQMGDVVVVEARIEPAPLTLWTDRQPPRWPRSWCARSGGARRASDPAAPTSVGRWAAAESHFRPESVVALRIPVALIAKADALLPPLAASGEHVNPSRSTVMRLALAEGLRVLARRYGVGAN
jgi:hypothetical protein